MPGPWKLLYDSVCGTSHEQAGRPCQDHAFGSTVRAGEETVLVVACADGAGSADFSEIGAKLACEEIIRRIAADLACGLKISDIDQGRFLKWYGEVRSCLEVEAKIYDRPLRLFACTLLTAVIGEASAAFSQIGDGAIVIANEGGYDVVMWPQSGEYANTTNFLTDETFRDRVEFSCREVPVDEIAMFTDGLQMLALVFATRTVHAPFFSSMFDVLRGAPVPNDLIVPLRDFLSSPRVNERTDDDKTLILATRRMAHVRQDAV